MGRLITVSLILILGAWGGAAQGAFPDDAAAAPSSATRQQPPAPPIKYLEAGARLFNSAADGAQLELAAKYLQAADLYRDQLQPDEQATLDAYLKELSKAKAVTAGGMTAPSATPVAAEPRPAPVIGAVPPGTAAVGPAGASSVVTTTDTKQRGRWLLHEAREQLHLGNYDMAQHKVEEAEALDIKWGLFDDTPAKVTEEIKKARPRVAAQANPVMASERHDRQTARAKLREARNALANKQFEQAEAIAIDVKNWGLTYGFLEDSPDKVASAARALRRRDKIRSTPTRDQSSQGVYDVLVQEARQKLSEQKFDEAEAKARMAQRMNVVPPLTADRAESVLHEVAMARAQNAPGAVSAATPVPSRSVKELKSLEVEREANVLLAKGDQQAAAAKFTEADRLRSAEALAAANITPALATSRVADPAVRQIAANDPPTTPDLAAPTDNPGQPVAAQPPANRGEVLLGEAKELFKSGNYPASRQLATQAKTGNFGVEAQADELITQIGLAEQGGALSLYEGALAALRAGDSGRARALLTEVAAAGESLDASMRAKVDSLLEKLTAGDKSSGKSGANSAQDAEALAAQKLNAEVGTKIAEGRRLHETDPDKAIAIYERTVQAVHAAGLSPELTRPMVRRLEVAIELAKKDKVAFEIKMQDKQLRAELELKRLRILEADKAKKTRLKELMDKAMTAFAEGNYIECEAFAKRAMEIDPNELAASMLVFKAKSERRFKQDLQNKNDKEEGAITAFQGVDMASIADPEVQLRDIKYAKDFKDLTQARLRMNAKLEPKKDPKVMAIEAKLKDRISINMDKQPLSEAVTFLTNYTGLNIVLDPKALADEGLAQSSPVTLVTSDTQLKTVLKLMLRPLGLTYKLEDDVILITSPQANQASTITQTYYVGDLVMPPDHSPQNLMPDKLMNKEQGRQQNDPNAGFGANPGTFPMGDPRMPQGFNSLGAATGERPKVDMTPIIQLITTSIAPGTWRVQDGYGGDATNAYGLGGGFGGDAGGIDAQRQPGAIVPFFLSISLIIKHTAEVHDQVADLLRQLRRLQDLQVSVEVRFITVNDTFFEFIGVDFDFQIQSDTVGKHSTFAIPNPAAALLSISSSGSTSTSSSSSTSTSSSSSTSGSSSSSTSGGSSTGGSSTGGGSTGGGSTGGATTGGGSTGGGGTTSGGSGGSSGQTQAPAYLVNPIRDNAYGSNAPYVVGTQGGGIANFSPNLNIPYTGPNQQLVAPTQYQSGTGATFGIAFLSDLEVYLFMTAAQGDTRSNVLQAPKVTTFNGAPATIFSNQVQYYVAGLIPIVGPGAVAYTPQIGSVPNGVTMTVTPVVSADRRYVRLTLSPFFNANNGFSTFTSQSGAVGGSGLGGGSAVITTTIQLPNTTTNTVTTTVTVPDGGTVLLGGVKTLNETRTEYGVPVLSKIPMIDRLFRNIGIGRTTNSLMLMVTPRIIILEEEEEALGIPSVAF